MKAVDKMFRLLGVSLAILLFFSFFFTDIAYARGGCFAGETVILTPNGERAIARLHQRDRLLGYNLSEHRFEEETIGKIQKVSASSYYLIDRKIKVTGTHPFYVQTEEGIKLIEAQNLKTGDRLIEVKESPHIISSIDYINKPIIVYNLISVNPTHNFYADGVLVHNKGGGGSGGGGGGGGGGTGRGGGGYTYNPFDNSKIFSGFMLAVTIFFLVLLPIMLVREIYNFIRFFGKKFTDNPDLIEFTRKVNPNFRDRYSVIYRKDNERWNAIPLTSELREQEYKQIVSKSELIEQVHRLLIQYQHDWTNKNFEGMKQYITEPFYSRQYNIFLRDFGDNFDIVYNPKLLEVAPISFKQEQDKYIFRVQINAEMINFSLSSQGYVLSGESYPRSFSEYWDIVLNSENKWFLMGIYQI